MAFLFDDALEGAAGVLVGVGVGLVAAMAMPAAGGKANTAVRPAAKRAIKGVLSITERMREATAEAREQWSDLVAEARSELHAGAQPQQQQQPQQQEQPAQPS